MLKPLLPIPQPTESYIYKITFYNGSEVNGTLYYNNETTFLKDADFKYGAQDSPAAPPVAFEYNGKAYKYTSSLNEVAQTAYKNIFTPKEPGYAVKQWNDVDGNKVISNLKSYQNSHLRMI